MTHLEQAIIEVIDRIQGCKGTELPSKLPREIFSQLENETPSDVIESLVQTGELIEVEYVLPEKSGLDYRSKSFLLPKGTRITIHGSERTERIRDAAYDVVLAGLTWLATREKIRRLRSRGKLVRTPLWQDGRDTEARLIRAIRAVPPTDKVG